ncbi:MAG: TonB family protein [Bacteroidota bacterium]
MRLLIPAFLLLLLPAAAHAQATAADSALVEAVLDATDWDVLEAGFMTGMTAQAGPAGAPGFEDIFDLEAVRDTARSALLADPDPDRLGAILTYLQSPTNEALTARSLANMEQMQTPAGMQRFMEQIQDPAPKKGTRADEGLARRLVEAQDLSDRTFVTMRRTFEALAEKIPAFQAELDQAPGGIDALVPEPDPATLAQMDLMQVRGAQIGNAGLPDAMLREAVAFAESEAGRFYNDLIFEATLDAAIPRMVDVMAEMFTALETASEAEEIEIVEVDDSMPPPPPEPEAVEIFEVAEVQPELIGGLAGLQRRVVYPEAARREGIEGQVVVQFVVDPQGRVIQPVVLRSPDDLLSEAAVAAVRGSKFTPGMQRGEPIHVRFAVPITFRLNNSSLNEIAEDIERYLGGPLPVPTLEFEEVFELADTPPELVGGMDRLESRLVYPEAARRDSVEGVVVVQLVVTEAGGAENAVVIESPDERLNDAALDAIRASRFTPGLKQERPVRSPVAIPVLFRLEDV